MTQPHRGGLISSFRYAFAGIWWAIKTQRNMRVHLVLGICAVLLAIALGLDTAREAILALTVTLVLVAEMINTVVEAVVDLVSPTYHPLARVAKDVAAGAVLVTAIGSVVVGLFIFLPYLLPLRRP
ncbi:MAG TPA: diacylglycerol kinase family protein [Chloroflexota bacterium]|nr:diacylglycerol kinase family protein [Chloroflexota bacterium]